MSFASSLSVFPSFVLMKKIELLMTARGLRISLARFSRPRVGDESRREQGRKTAVRIHASATRPRIHRPAGRAGRTHGHFSVSPGGSSFVASGPDADSKHLIHEVGYGLIRTVSRILTSSTHGLTARNRAAAVYVTIAESTASQLASKQKPQYTIAPGRAGACWYNRIRS